VEDFLPINRVDHLEFYVGNAKQAAHYYRTGFGFALCAYSGLETGSRETASYVMEQGKIRLVLTTALGPDHPIARHTHLHGDGVGIIGLEVPDAASAYRESTKRGATGAIPPKEVEDENGIYRYSAIHCYGDTLIKFVDRSDYHGPFAPTYRPMNTASNGNGHKNGSRGDHKGVGLASIDHMVGMSNSAR
jgi:4-hydroxyphenylpyruvate dioxygenase